MNSDSVDSNVCAGLDACLFANFSTAPDSGPILVDICQRGFTLLHRLEMTRDFGIRVNGYGCDRLGDCRSALS